MRCGGSRRGSQGGRALRARFALRAGYFARLAPPMDTAALIADLRATRAHMRAVADDLDGAREYGPLLAIVNPPRWEVGHVGWFQEYWCLRRHSKGLYAPERGDSILPNADGFYN